MFVYIAWDYCTTHVVANQAKDNLTAPEHTSSSPTGLLPAVHLGAAGSLSQSLGKPGHGGCLTSVAPVASSASYHFAQRYHIWGGWMASPTRSTWVWVNSRSWWWTGRPGVLQSMGSQRVGHDWATELSRTTSETTDSFRRSETKTGFWPPRLQAMFSASSGTWSWACCPWGLRVGETGPRVRYQTRGGETSTLGTLAGRWVIADIRGVVKHLPSNQRKELTTWMSVCKHG